MWGLAWAHKIGQLVSFLWMQLWKSSSLFSSLVAVKVIWEYKLIFLGYCVAGEHGIGLGQIKTPQSSLVLPRFSHFFLVSASQVAAWLPLISRVLRILASSFISFMERRVFGGLYSAIFANIILFVFSWWKFFLLTVTLKSRHFLDC